MRIGSLFSGIGGLELGLEWSGLGHTVWQVEQCPKLRNCLACHWPAAERFDDVCTVGAHNLAPVDLICGGFPCQDVSSAGKRVGLTGARSGLWFEFSRIVSELRPEWVVVENVASGAQKWVDAVRGDLERRDYVSLPIPLAAADVGAWHQRERIFLVSYRNCELEGRLPERGKKAIPELSNRGAVAANGNGTELRDKPRRRRGQNGQGSAIATADTTNADGGGEPQSQGRKPDVGRWACDSSVWSTEPDVARMVHGLPGRVDREHALGNAVVPQCAEVVGYVIQLMGS